jgi:hypothetical protein
MIRWLIALLIWLGLIEKPRFLARYVEHHPSLDELSFDDLVVVRSGTFTKWACFRCPCGCGEKVALSLAENRRPAWRVSVDWLRRPTIKPSVWLTDCCRSHFWITNGCIQWVQDKGLRPEV